MSFTLLTTKAKKTLRSNLIALNKKHTHNRLQQKLRSIFRLLFKKINYNYEPLQIREVFYIPKREWEERWRLIKLEIEAYEATSLLDIGCAEGWFIRRAAEDLGCFSIGVDIDNTRLLLGEISRLHDRGERYATIKAKLNVDDIEKLPQFDIVLCLSVVHHIIRIDGVDEACKFINAIGKIARKAVIFEMGTSEEKEMAWAKNMPLMKNGQSDFIKDFLSDAGFKKIRELGSTPSIEKGSNRILFIAEPKHS